MLCTRCGGQLRVIRTVSAGEMGRASATRCLSCRVRYVYITTPYVATTGYGTGVESVAKKLKNGAIKAVRDDEERSVPEHTSR